MPNFDSLTATLARFAGELTPAAIPASVKARIALHFIDSLAAALPAAKTACCVKARGLFGASTRRAEAWRLTVELRSPPAAPRSLTPLR